MTPFTIQMLLTCHWSPTPEDQYEPKIWNSDAGTATRGWLMDNGLIDDHWKVTARGRALVNILCTTPLPVLSWVAPEKAEFEG